MIPSASGQSRRWSAIEAATNQAIGFGVALVLSFIVLPAHGYDVTGGDALSISVVFAVASAVRGYIVRRTFNWWHHRG